MMAKSKIIAKGVADLIEAIAQETVISSIIPTFDLDRATGRQVHCWPSDRQSILRTRSLQELNYSISIALIEKTNGDDEATEENLSLLEFIGDSLIGKQFTATTTIDDQDDELICHVLGYEHAPLYDREILETRRTFAGGLILQVQVAEPLLRTP